jgi:3-oxoacyl-[acyl-carrier-protein] synthase II
MRAALEDAGVEPHQVTHINAHATSTPLGDKIELKAIETLFGDHSPNIAVTSAKGAVGHLLGAAGSVEAIFTIMSIFNSQIPPTLNLEEPLDTKVKLVGNKSMAWEVAEGSSHRIALTNSFGFGGTNASLLMSSYSS